MTVSQESTEASQSAASITDQLSCSPAQPSAECGVPDAQPQQEYYMYEVIVVWSCELLQQLSNVMIAGESSVPAPCSSLDSSQVLGTIHQEPGNREKVRHEDYFVATLTTNC